MSQKINFTKAALDAIKPPPAGGRIVVHDAKTRGLQLRVSGAHDRSKGTAEVIKTFSVYRRAKGGKPERVTLGRFPEMTIEQARRKAAQVNAAFENHENPAERRRTIRGEPTFADIFDLYLRKHAKVRKRTWKEDEAKYTKHLAARLGKRKISTITRGEIKALHGELTAAGTPIAANRVLALVSSVFGWAVSMDMIETNPASKIKKNGENSRDRFLQADELPRFFRSLEQEDEIYRDYFLLLLITGVRRANLMAMRFEEISWERAEWRIPQTKNGTPHVVSLDDGEDFAMSILRRRREGASGPWVFPGTGKTGHLAEPRKAFLRVLERAGIGDCRIHDIRRTLGSWMASTGATDAIIGRQLNQKSVAATRVYSRLSIEPVKQARNVALKAILDTRGALADDDADAGEALPTANQPPSRTTSVSRPAP